MSIEPETRDIPKSVETTWTSLRSILHWTDGDETVHESSRVRHIEGMNCGMVCIGRGREEGGSKGVRRSCGSSVADIMIRYSLTETGKERNFQLPRAVPAAISRM